MTSISESTGKATKRKPRRCTFHWIPAWACVSAGGALKSVPKKVLFPFEVLLVVLVAMLIISGSQGFFPSRGGVDHREDIVLKFEKEVTSIDCRTSQAR